MTHLKSQSLTTQSALLTGLAGGATAQAMSLWGGDLARFLPPLPFLTLAAAFGGACAGVVLAKALGRSGWIGVMISALAWPVATLLGAVLAAIPFGLVDAATHVSATEMLFTAVESAAPLGLLAIGDGIANSPYVATIWVLSATCIHIILRRERSLST
ncbi:hypothetical protein [uncultured Tateyamaria sp.]|uniref:hypothetical protein n=1 Tax=uncultured Tateyamaria sp. TaxID=455651 RepID=UPI0026081367|nr:hypothetical protein [uncultured Tateyamaria sp.]